MANLAVRLIQINFCIIYMSSGLAKLKGTTWWDATGNWTTLTNGEFSLIHYHWYKSLVGLWIENRGLWLASLTCMTYFTLGLEISFPFLAWSRLRPWVVTGAVILHSMISALMGLVIFELLMMTMLLSFYPASVVRAYLSWPPGSGVPLTVRYSARNRKHARMVVWLRTFDLAGQIKLSEAGKVDEASEEPVKLIEPDGEIHTGSGIVSSAMRHLVFLRWGYWAFFVPAQLVKMFLPPDRGGLETHKEPVAARRTAI